MTDTDKLLVTLVPPTTPSIIKVIGVGGGGGNAVGQMYRDGLDEVRCLVCNTDAKALADSPVPEHLQMGPGLGAGGDPVIGRQYAEESAEKIEKALDGGTKMVFITAGMGGGTGTGASPVIARIARAKGILTVGIVTLPFLFERERQINKALDGLDALAAEVDALLVINNQRLLEIYPETNILQAFRLADRTLSKAVGSITEIISMRGRVNLDFRDVNMVLRGGGVSVMSDGYGEGEGRLTKAISAALNSPLLNNNDIYRASRLLLAITFNPGEGVLQTEELNELAGFMQKFEDGDIEFKYGMATDRDLGHKVKVTLLASGFSLYGGKKEERAAEDDEETLRRGERRAAFYDTAQGGRRQPAAPRLYIFRPEDLLNEDLIAEVERVPTRKRNAGQLRRIKDCAKPSPDCSQSNGTAPATAGGNAASGTTHAAPEVIRPGDTISFGPQ